MIKGLIVFILLSAFDTTYSMQPLTRAEKHKYGKTTIYLVRQNDKIVFIGDKEHLQAKVEELKNAGSDERMKNVQEALKIARTECTDCTIS